MDLMTEIAAKQLEFMARVSHVEERNGCMLGPSRCPVDIQMPTGQLRLKTFLWAITEELTEALDCFDDIRKLEEELIDVLHFYVEVLLLSGLPIPTTTFVQSYLEKFSERGVGLSRIDRSQSVWVLRNRTIRGGFEDRWRETVQSVGRAGHCLKNRPWKTGMVYQETEAYAMHLGMGFNWLLELFGTIGLGLPGIYELYARKNAVNHQRQDKGY